MKQTPKTTLDRDDIAAIAQAVSDSLQKPVSTDDADVQELFRNRTLQHALSVSLGKPTPPEPGQPFDGANPYADLDDAGQFARETNRSEAYDGDGSTSRFSNVFDSDDIIETLAKMVLDRQKGK